MNLKKLKEPFAAKDIEWRVQRSGESNGKLWAMVLAYVTNRAVMDRLDDVCGAHNWRNEFKKGPIGGLLCGISIKVGDEWVTKWDGAEETQVEKIKGGFSASMKRAAVQWGIGRYLYNLDATFVNDTGKKSSHRDSVKTPSGNKTINWDDPKLPKWALPEEIDKASILNSDLDRCTDLEALEEIRVKISNGHYGSSDDQKAKDSLVAKMRSMGGAWDSKQDRFVFTGPKVKEGSYEWWIDKADAVEGDLLAWWEMESGPAGNDLSPDEMKKLNNYVSQLVDIAGEEAGKSDESCKESDGFESLMAEVDALKTSMAVDKWRAGKSAYIVKNFNQADQNKIFEYADNAYNMLKKAEGDEE